MNDRRAPKRKRGLNGEKTCEHPARAGDIERCPTIIGMVENIGHTQISCLVIYFYDAVGTAFAP